MVSGGTKKIVRKIMPSTQLIFLISVMSTYFVLWIVDPEKTILALRNSMGVFFHLLFPLFLVFLFMIGLNIFLKPPQLAKYIGKDASLKSKLLSIVAGIISAGPIYAWYPLLKDLYEKGVKRSLLAIFLVNRAVKPYLLPVMISFFGWAYVLILTLLTIAGSLCVGFFVGAFETGSTGSLQNNPGSGAGKR